MLTANRIITRQLKGYYNTNPNGKSRGTIFYFEDEQVPRLKDAYLRYSISKYYIRNINFTSKNEESVYLTPGGSVFFSNKTMPHYNLRGYPLHRLRTNQKSKYTNKLLCSFLKSSFFLWFMITKHEHLNFYQQEILAKINLPKLNLQNPNI